MTDPTIAILCPARPNSEWLAHFLLSYSVTIHDAILTELLIAISEHDTWNDTARKYMDGRDGIKFYNTPPNNKMGRFGHHIYYNRLVRETNADWVILACDDWDFIMQDWDKYLREFIIKRGLGADGVHAIFPRLPGNMVCTMFSRGYINLMDGVVSRHWSVDTYTSNVVHGSDMVYLPTDEAIFIDYTQWPETKGTTPKECLPTEPTLPYSADPNVKELTSLDILAVNSRLGGNN